MVAMNAIQEVNPASTYFEEMPWTVFGMRIFSGNVGLRPLFRMAG